MRKFNDDVVFGSGAGTIDSLPLTPEQKIKVLEWWAGRMWLVLEEADGETDYAGKSYDPLVIDPHSAPDGPGVAHSYVFCFGDHHYGGRHHDYASLRDLERRMTLEFSDSVRGMMDCAVTDARG